MKREISIVIDVLTDCIEDVSTGEKRDTIVKEASLKDIQRVLKKKEWSFDWIAEHQREDRKVYKLLTKNDKVVQGLVSVEVRERFIEIHLIESAPHNLGDNRQHAGVGGNMFAFVCKESFDKGFEGYVGFEAKTALIEHYTTKLGAHILFGKRLSIATPAAQKLVNLYYKDVQ